MLEPVGVAHLLPDGRVGGRLLVDLGDVAGGVPLADGLGGEVVAVVVPGQGEQPVALQHQQHVVGLAGGLQQADEPVGQAQLLGGRPAA